MAYGKKYHTSYQSLNGWDYYMEIYVNGFTGSSAEISLGDNGCEISYGTNKSDRANTILSSKMSFNFIVSTPSEEIFIDDLKGTLNEKDVYVYLYKSTTNDCSPIWSGFLLMDLGAKEDVEFPYKVKLTAVDGLALLKNRDFIKPGSVKPYDYGDVFTEQKKIRNHILSILREVGCGGVAEGNYEEIEVATSVNWFNQKNPGSWGDPFDWNKISCYWAAKPKDMGAYDVENCYEVLHQILKVWHCRIVFWENKFWIVQIPELNTTNSGTNSAPININTFTYGLLSGNYITDNPYIGTLENTRYEIHVGKTSPMRGVQKLTGTQYDFYPRLKKVFSNFVSGGGNNYYLGFPERTTQTGGVTSTPFNQISVLDAASAGSMYFNFPLNVALAGVYANWEMVYDLKATNGTVTRWLHRTGWGSSQILSWVSSEPANTNKPLWGVYSNNFWTPPSIYNITFSVDPDTAFTGIWDFEFIVDDSTWGTSGSWFLAQEPFYGTVTTNPQISFINIPNTSSTVNPNEGLFMLVNLTGGVDSEGVDIIMETSDDNSYSYDFEKLRHGDTIANNHISSILTWDGTVFEGTEFIGEWGIGNTTGDEPLVEMLMKEFIYGQTQNTKIINTTLSTSVIEKETDDGTLAVPEYINPVGRIRELTTGVDSIYVFKKGVFITGKDEWKYDGWEIERDIPTLTTTTTTNWGPYGPPEDDGGVISARVANPDGSGVALRNMAVTRTTADVTGVTTSIPIEAMGSDLYSEGARLLILNLHGGNHIITLSANQTATDTSLSIDSYDFGYEVITIGSLISYDQFDLSSQYQNKTRGTVGGLAVTSTEIGPLHSDGNIDGVDTEYIKILPRDFMPNDDQYNKGIAFDETATTGVKVYSADTELWAFVQIPYGKEATDCEVYGNNTKVVDVFELSIDASGIGTAVATGSVGTSFRISTPVGSDTVNYLGIRVTTTGTAQRIYGGKIILTDI
jgi:hypothetical protein